MSPRALTGIEKSAILLMCLGEHAAAQVFNELSDDEVQKITRAMASINHIPKTLKNRVLDQYRDAQQQFTGDFFKGSEFAKNSIYATSSGPRTEVLLNRHVTETESKPFAVIAGMKPQMAARFLEKEHPQIMALIISTQRSDHGAAIISELPESVQTDVIHRIARLENVAEDVMSTLESSMSKEAGRTLSQKQKQINGFNRAVDLLSSMSADVHNTILESLEESDDHMAEQMRRQMFSFERLVDFDDRSLQMILREINNESLAIALQNCSEDLQKRFFSNMSPRAVAMVRDDIESLGEISATEIKATQQSIVKAAMRLEENGAFAASPPGAHV